MIKGFAFRAIDDSMDPAYRTGDLVFARTWLEPLAGHDIVLIGDTGVGGIADAVFARLVAVKGDNLMLRQFGSGRAWQEVRSRWARTAVVVGCYRRL